MYKISRQMPNMETCFKGASTKLYFIAHKSMCTMAYFYVIYSYVISEWRSIRPVEINQYDITMSNDVARDVHCEITMGNDVARDIYCDITMSNDVAM